MNRTSKYFLGLMAYLLGLACHIPALGQSKAGDLPIADVHFHFMLFMKPDELLERMKKNNISWVVSSGAIGSPAVGNPWVRDWEVKKYIGNRFVPAVGGSETYQAERSEGIKFYTDAQNARRDAVITRMNDLLKDGHRAIVETFPNAESTSADPMRRRRLPTNAPFFKEAMQLAIRYDMPLPMHMQWHPESMHELEALLTEFPRGRVVWSHCGNTTSAKEVRPLLERFSNVYCDLGFRGMPQLAHDRLRDQGRTIYWPESTFKKADLLPDWRQLIEDFPNRFMLSIDDVQSWEEYDAVVAANRTGVLDKLSSSTAEKVAYKNAIKVFRLPD